MASKRQQQVESMLKQQMADLLIREGRNYYGRAFVTMTNVKVTPDLMTARFYFSVYNVTDKQAVIDTLSENVHSVRRSLGAKIRNKVRRIPELEFYLDDTLDEVYHMEDVFSKLNIPPAEEEE